jgi:hypothetical protein
MIIAVMMPEINIEPIKRNADGARSIPPDIASPLVQPPAIPAPYSRMIPPINNNSHLFHSWGPKIVFHCSSFALAVSRYCW